MIVRTYEPGSNIKLIGKALKHVAAGVPQDTFTCVGDLIPTHEQDFLKGHGTQKVGEDQLQATVCGVVERINKLILVKPVKTRYHAQLGDVVVGRVTAVHGNDWKIDLNSRQNAKLAYQSVHRGGVQKVVREGEQMAMREVFVEGDLLVAEVQKVGSEGGVDLHIRTLKFGKLSYGQLVVVPSQLVKRQKQHFRTLDALGVDLVLGLNGLIWVCPTVQRGTDGAPLAAAAPPAAELRGVCVRVAGAIQALAALYLQIHPESISDAYQLSIEGGVRIKDMTEKPFLEILASSEVLRRGQTAAAAQAGW